MKFVSRSLYCVYSYDIHMEDLVSSIYHLIVDLSAERIEDLPFSSWAHNLFNIHDVLGIDKLPDYMDEESFLNHLIKYLADQLYTTTSKLKKTGIVLLYREGGFLIASKSSHPDKILTRWIKDFCPLNYLFDLIVAENIKVLKKQFLSLINEAHYSRAVQAHQKTPLESCIIRSEWIKFDQIEPTPIDESSIWMEPSWLDIMDIKDSCDAYSLSCMGQFWGITCGEYTIPFVNADDRIKAENYADYFIKMFQCVYSPDKQKGDVSKDKLLPFIAAGKKSDFCRLLSNLKYNLYLDSSVEIPIGYSSLFEEVLCLNNISFMSDYQLFSGIPSEDQRERASTILGVYENEKKGSEYNLVGWANAGNELVEVTKSSSNSSSKYVRVRTLLPRYSYYFLSRFFEDNFASMLKEIACNHMQNATLSYKTAEQSSIEIDAILFKNDGTLVFVENKTTMSRRTVESTIEKIENFHSIMQKEYPLVKIEYCIVAPYCDGTLECSYKYFINNGNNTPPETRIGVAHRIFDFNIPLAQFQDKYLRCIVEPEYELMKEKIRDLLQ